MGILHHFNNIVLDLEKIQRRVYLHYYLQFYMHFYLHIYIYVQKRVL